MLRMARRYFVRHEVEDAAGADAAWVTGGGAIIGVEFAMSGRAGCVSAPLRHPARYSHPKPGSQLAQRHFSGQPSISCHIAVVAAVAAFEL